MWIFFPVLSPLSFDTPQLPLRRSHFLPSDLRHEISITIGGREAEKMRRMERGCRALIHNQNPEQKLQKRKIHPRYSLLLSSLLPFAANEICCSLAFRINTGREGEGQVLAARTRFNTDRRIRLEVSARSGGAQIDRRGRKTIEAGSGERRT